MAALPCHGSTEAKPRKVSGCLRTQSATKSLVTGGRPLPDLASQARSTAMTSSARNSSAISSTVRGLSSVRKYFSAASLNSPMASPRYSRVAGWTCTSMARLTASRAGQLSRVVAVVTLPQPVVAVVGLGQRVGPEAGEALGLLDVVDDRLIEIVGVEVVDDLGPL